MWSVCENKQDENPIFCDENQSGGYDAVCVAI